MLHLPSRTSVSLGEKQTFACLFDCKLDQISAPTFIGHWLPVTGHRLRSHRHSNHSNHSYLSIPDPMLSRLPCHSSPLVDRAFTFAPSFAQPFPPHTLFNVSLRIVVVFPRLRNFPPQPRRLSSPLVCYSRVPSLSFPILLIPFPAPFTRFPSVPRNRQPLLEETSSLYRELKLKQSWIQGVRPRYIPSSYLSFRTSPLNPLSLLLSILVFVLLTNRLAILSLGPSRPKSRTRFPPRSSGTLPYPPTPLDHHSPITLHARLLSRLLI